VIRHPMATRYAATSRSQSRIEFSTFVPRALATSAKRGGTTWCRWRFGWSLLSTARWVRQLHTGNLHRVRLSPKRCPKHGPSRHSSQGTRESPAEPVRDAARLPCSLARTLWAAPKRRARRRVHRSGRFRGPDPWGRSTCRSASHAQALSRAPSWRSDKSDKGDFDLLISMSRIASFPLCEPCRPPGSLAARTGGRERPRRFLGPAVPGWPPPPTRLACAPGGSWARSPRKPPRSIEAHTARLGPQQHISVGRGSRAAHAAGSAETSIPPILGMVLAEEASSCRRRAVPKSSYRTGITSRVTATWVSV
jgi:hypothetical protein